jgi:hypothetical protein
MTTPGHIPFVLAITCALTACELSTGADTHADPTRYPGHIHPNHMWIDPARRHTPHTCTLPRHHQAPSATPFDPAAAASAPTDAEATRLRYARELRGRVQCYQAPNSFILCVTRPTAQFGGLLFGSRDALWHRHPASTSRDGATRLYGLHDPIADPTKRPYSDCALSPEHDPATQGCFSIRDGKASLQCGDALVTMRPLDTPEDASWLARVPVYFMPTQHTILWLAATPDGALVYRDRIVVPVERGTQRLDLLYTLDRLATGLPGSMTWQDPNAPCDLCDVASPITNPDDIDHLRALLPELAIGWPAHEPVCWSGECEIYRGQTATK